MTSAFGDQEVPMMTSASNVGEGWHPLIHELEAGLNAVDPNFEIQQVKEKFGGLRYYAQTRGDLERSEYQAFHHLIAEAEERSVHICEECGAPGETHSINGWFKTFCDPHREERLQRMRDQS